MKRLIKTFIYTLARLWPWRGAVVLMYHSIGENPEFFTVTPKEFEKQMAYLDKHHFNVISVSDLMGKLQRKETIPFKTVVITIDDGYEDNYTQAFPILKKYKLPASIFVTTDLIGQSTIARKGTVMNKLGWSQMQELIHSDLVEVFPHSHTHPKLDILWPEFAEKEIQVSRQTLENQLGRSLPIFAYPYGRYNREVVQILKQQGFRAAFTVKTGRIHQGDDLLLLKRNSIDSKVSFAMFKGIIKFGRI